MNKLSHFKFKEHWLSLFALCTFLLYDFIQLNVMSSIASFALNSIKLNTYQLGFISSLFFYVNMVLLFPAGILLDSTQPKWLMIISLAITIIGILFFAFSPSIQTMIIWRSFSGVAGAFSYLSCVKILSKQFPRKYLGLLLGSTGIVIMAAGVIAQYPLVWLLTTIGLNTTMLLDGCFGIVVIVLIIRLIESSPANNNVLNSIKNLRIKHVFIKNNNWLIAIYACCTNFPLFVLGALWGNLYLRSKYNLTLETAAFITSMIFIGNMVGAPLLGFFSDKTGHRKYLMILCGIMMFICNLVIMFLPDYSSTFLFVLLFFFLGISTGSQTLAYASIVDINEQDDIAKSTSMLSFLSVSGGAIAQPLFGLIIGFSQTENYQNGMYIMLLSSIIATMVSVYLPIKDSHASSNEVSYDLRC